MKQQLTKNAIRESFLKLLAQRSFDKITVKSIVEDCGLTRNTFYYYYEDTYDILDDILSQEITRYSEMMASGTPVGHILDEFCDYAENNQNLVNHVLRSSKWDELKLYVQKALDRGVEAIISGYACGRPLDPGKRDVIKNVYRASVGGLIEQWFTRGNIRGMRERIDVLTELFGDSIEKAVERSVEK